MWTRTAAPWRVFRGLAGMFERLERPWPPFLFSLGPDQTGRGRQTSLFGADSWARSGGPPVLKHYGLKTLLYGTLLPPLRISRGDADRSCVTLVIVGLKLGVHTYNHIKWQDYVAQSDEVWTRRETDFWRRDEFAQVFLAAASDAWGPPVGRSIAFVPDLERQLGFQYASDGRGTGPFMPVCGRRGRQRPADADDLTHVGRVWLGAPIWVLSTPSITCSR